MLKLFNYVVDIGEQMLVSGAEVHRVEESINRMCLALGALRTDVFIITSSIVVTIHTSDGETYTQTRRVTATTTNFEKLHLQNELSREICDKPITEPEIVNPYAGQTIEQFYENSAFVGDSVMFGLEIYSRRKKTAESNATFLTLASFAARHALSDVWEGSYHPTYNGEKMKVEDALVLDGANNVFLFLGLNDVRVTPKEYFENYVKFIDRIKEKSPDINIFIISTTYPIESPHSMDTQTSASYRDQLKDLNEKLYEYSLSTDAYYIDVITPLLSDKGFLDDKYTSDKYVHLTNTAYEIWTKIIDEYVLSLIETGLPPVQVEELIENTENISESTDAINEVETQTEDINTDTTQVDNQNTEPVTEVIYEEII